MRSARHWRLWLIGLAAALLVSAFLSLGLGSTEVGLGDAARVLGGLLTGGGAPGGGHDAAVGDAPAGTDDPAATVVLQIRLPRTILALLAGALLALAGVIMQAFFRNPMAEPYLVGVSAGAALGAVLAMLLGWAGVGLAWLSPVPLAAFAGAMATVVLVYALNRGPGGMRSEGLLLTGLAISSALSAIVALLLVTSQRAIQQVAGARSRSAALGGCHERRARRARLAFADTPARGRLAHDRRRGGGLGCGRLRRADGSARRAPARRDEPPAAHPERDAAGGIAPALGRHPGAHAARADGAAAGRDHRDDRCAVPRLSLRAPREGAMVKLKIAFVGTHGVGKTTLCYELAAWLKRREVRVDMVREVARRCPLPINRETTLDAQSWILHAQIAEEIHLANQQDAVVCDRSVIDNYAYLVHRLAPPAWLDELVRHWAHTYTHLFKVPIVDPPRFDGVRDTSREFQEAIDAEVERLLARFEVGVYRLAPEERGRWIEEIGERIGALPEAPQMGLFREG
jgi:thymidylate kinase